MNEIKYVTNLTEINGIIVKNNANDALEYIKRGEQVARFEYGDSMSPILLSGEYCILTPLKENEEANVGDAVFCEVNGCLMTHMVIMKSKSAKNNKLYYLIGSTDMQIFGWTDKIFAFANGTRILTW